MRARWSAPALLSCLMLGACTSSSSAPTSELAGDQALRVAIPTEVGLDPAQIATDLEYSIAQNLFSGLFRFDEQLREQPDLAAAMPEVSADGLMYRIKLRTDARFWDGHPVTAQDVVYSWNRAIDQNGPYSSIFQPILGYQEVQDSLNSGQKPVPLRGLTAPDEHTVVMTLAVPAGYLTATLALPVAWVVNQADVELNGRTWSDEPNAAVGTGPFRLTSRALGHSMTLVPVENWWGGATGWLKKVTIDIVPDTTKELRGYLDGRFDLIGLGGYGGPNSDGAIVGKILAADPRHASEVHSFPFGRTDWLGFDVKTGPFSGAQGSWGRRAFSLAIDRTRLARAVCAGGILCVGATGGLISKGLAGYLGDGSDPMSTFDPKTAKADLQQWDPTGAKRENLTYVYVANALFREVADNLRDQWKANLGITVQLQGYDPDTFIFDRTFGDYTMFRGSWAADYNSPQDWYDIFIGSQNPSGSGYAESSFFEVLARADASSGDAADGEYRQAGRMLLDQAVVAPLIYFTHTSVVKAYVDGFGANAFGAYPLKDVKILQH
jgi:oligopeptide transport system substrate-binding protein